ncbi:MAG: DnaJ domain-containing protein [Hyphomicrobiaceae bacterium]|nr:MAG: DnaJ domain-containing protein [Hyphomicrobiaceae bacterium]
MKLDSKYFDCIRVRPDLERLARERSQQCQWQGCADPGLYRAPRGRGREGQYFRFCLNHVREYNQNYNYFAGMSDEEVASFHKDAVTGHRPTWKTSVNSQGPNVKDYIDGFDVEEAKARRAWRRWNRAFSFTGADREAADRRASHETARRRPVRNMERKALEALGLDGGSSRATIKARFKELVKRHHPDRNGGDRSSEEMLREVIQAYNYLKQAGFV